MQNRRSYRHMAVALLLASATVPVFGQQARTPTTRPTEYMVATAHLDTQWLWTIQDTIRTHIPKTMRDNLALIEKYPDYHFSFEGAFRYSLMKEYYPQDYARLKQAIADGRWHVCGSWWDAVDSNMPSPESLVRQTLYGNGFFEKEFGKTSTDVYLPDCFGFSAALPAVARHCGLTGFSTQKLSWGSANGIPFTVGKWQGIGGATIFAALDPGGYGDTPKKDLSHDDWLLGRANKLGEQAGVAVDYRYFGTGDTGGAPAESGVKWVESSIHSDGPLRVINAPADQIFRDLAEADTSRLPMYSGELVLTRHGTGCYTSQSAMKRWNRQNETLGAMAETAAVSADLLGTMPYPAETLSSAWKRFLWHQFHDDLTGTSIPQVYAFSWNDELLAQKMFAGVLEDAAAAVIDQMDTDTKGTPVVVYNALPWERTAPVRVKIPGTGQCATVYTSLRVPIPAAIITNADGSSDVTFLATLPPAGFEVFDVRITDRPLVLFDLPPVNASPTLLENDRLRVSLSPTGDITSIYDKQHERELLSGPIQLQLLANNSKEWPAWEVLYEDITSPPKGVVADAPKIEVLNDSADTARVRVTRSAGESSIEQTISLPAKAAEVVVDTRINWHTPATTLKAAFPLSAANARAQYDIGLGTIQRGNDTPKLYEAPAQKWAGITDTSGQFGVAILSDCRYGWDKPDDHTLRLTLVNTPLAPAGFGEQATNDLGHHRLRYAILPYGPEDIGSVYRAADELSTPAVAFVAGKHSGKLGRSFSLLQVSDPAVRLMALKKSEDGKAYVARFVNTADRPVEACRITVAGRILDAAEADGRERATGGTDRLLSLSFAPNQIRTLRLAIAPQRRANRLPETQIVALPRNERLTSPDGAQDSTRTIPQELWPSSIRLGNRPFFTADAAGYNAVACKGQTIELPDGAWDHVTILAAATDAESVETAFALDGSRSISLQISPMVGKIGQWDSRIINGRFTPRRPDTVPGFLNPDRVAYTFTHLHEPDGSNALYTFGHLFAYELADGRDINRVTLPNDPRIKIVAMTAEHRGDLGAALASPLLDRFPGVKVIAESHRFADQVAVRLVSDRAGVPIHYTLDGTQPTAASPRYTGPLTVTQDCTLTAIAMDGESQPEEVVQERFTKAPLHHAIATAPASAGLTCRYYEGRFQTTDGLKGDPVSERTAASIDLSSAARKERFGLVFEGYIKVPADGVYRFYTNSDDGSRLWIGDELIVDNDGMHSASEESGEAVLQAGWHPIRIAYIQGAVDAVLEVAWRGPGMGKQPIPASALGH